MIKNISTPRKNACVSNGRIEWFFFIALTYRPTMGSSPSLFGQVHSNRDYSDVRYWGKNQFNSSFPASLVAYMSHIGIDPVYIKVNSDNQIQHDCISPTALFGIDPLSDSLFYSYETNYPPYDKYYIGKRESIDLVLIDRHTDAFYRGLEIRNNSTTRLVPYLLSPERRFDALIVNSPSLFDRG